MHSGLGGSLLSLTSFLINIEQKGKLIKEQINLREKGNIVYLR